MEYVKICGLKRIEDINICIEKGATAVGFVYNVPDSPRNLKKSEILNILKQIPKKIKTVITFRASNVFDIQNVMNEIEADLYQAHFSFNLNDLDKISNGSKKRLIIALKANHNSKQDVIKLINSYNNQFFAFLLDNSQGSGTQFDFNLLFEIKNRTSGSKLIIAGGINNENLESLIRVLKPYGIDASSSLESEKGIKDSNKIKEFLGKINEIKDSIKKVK
jgi:phosphoribosylanthranilate isomerase